MDRRWYLVVNRFATRTAWAHGVMAFLARPLALVILAVLLLVALVRARVTGFGGTDLDKIARLVWVAVGTALAYAVSLPVVHLVGRARPFTAMAQAVVLVTRPTGFSFPNEEAVIAGAFVTGLWLSRVPLMATASTLIAIAIALAVVYTGTAYPGDAAAGLLLGILASLVMYPLAIGSLRALVRVVARSPFKPLVGGGHRGRSVGPGPAAHPELVGESGTVRILPSHDAQAVRALPPVKTRTVRVLPPDEAGTVRILPPDETGARNTGADTTGSAT